MEVTRHSDTMTYMTFNQDMTCFAVATTQGFYVYSIDPYRRVYAHEDGGAGVIEMMYSSSLLAVSGHGDNPSFSARRLRVLNTVEGNTLAELNFGSAILALRMTRTRLVVVLHDKIIVHDLNNLNPLETITTPTNSKGLVALGGTFLAYPGSSQTGELILFDASALHAVAVVPAHNSPLAHVAFNQSASLVATASEKGTVVRVFSVPQGEKIATFRRGAYPAVVYSLSFSGDDAFLCASSDTGTVHLFSLSKGNAADDSSKTEAKESSKKDDEATTSTSSNTNTNSNNNSSSSSNNHNSSDANHPHPHNHNHNGMEAVASSALSAASSAAEAAGQVVKTWVPGIVSSLFEPARDFAFLKLRNGVPALCAPGANASRVNVLTAEGNLHVYGVDLRAGGECGLQREYKLHLDANEVARLARELAMLARDAPPGIAVWPVDDMMDTLDAQICGVDGTPYEHGVFKLRVTIPPQYPLEPPHVRFVTPIYHPNIDSAGRICLDTLNMPPKGAWTPSLNVSTLLTSIQALMGDPNPGDGLVPEITQEYQQNPEVFAAHARAHTKQHAHGHAADDDTKVNAKVNNVNTNTGANANAGASRSESGHDGAVALHGKKANEDANLKGNGTGGDDGVGDDGDGYESEEGGMLSLSDDDDHEEGEEEEEVDGDGGGEGVAPPPHKKKR